MTEIFSAELLRGLVFLYNPVRNRNKKNQMQHFADTKEPSPLLCKSPVAAKYLVTWMRQFDRLQSGTAPIPNTSQQS